MAGDDSVLVNRVARSWKYDCFWKSKTLGSDERLGRAVMKDAPNAIPDNTDSRVPLLVET